MDVNNPLPDNAFILNPKNKVFVEGGTRRLGGTSTVRYLIRFAAVFYFMMALPIAILIAFVFSLLGQGSFIDFFIFEAIFMMLLTIYMTYMGYKTRHALETKGKVLVGEVAEYDTRASFSMAGYKKVPRLKYRFVSPKGLSLSGSTLIPAKYKSRLPDGRELPQIGTQIAVLYADDKKHTIL